GTTLQQAFPPPPSTAPLPESDHGPLSVLRHAPDGEVPLAPNLSVTFSQPMVPLTSHAALSAMDLPLKLSPAPAGEWRWVGTRTLLFQPQTRFPMATRYEVTVPAATKSSLGNRLASAASWTFTTPPPRLLSYAPSSGPQGLDPVIFVGFDQQVDA